MAVTRDGGGTPAITRSRGSPRGDEFYRQHRAEQTERRAGQRDRAWGLERILDRKRASWLSTFGYGLWALHASIGSPWRCARGSEQQVKPNTIDS